jgi:hypothetical protein
MNCFNCLLKIGAELTDIAPVILIHHSGSDIDVILPGQSGARGHTTVGAARNTDLQKAYDTMC